MRLLNSPAGRLAGRIVWAGLAAASILAGQVGAAPQSRAADEHQAYLPLVLHHPRAESIFGMDMINITDSQGLPLVAGTTTYWVRQAAIEWSDIEAVEGEYDFDPGALDWLHQGLLNASARGMQVVLVVRGTPAWARADGQTHLGPWCGPIAQDKFEAFGDFMHEVVSRYSAPPYNALYWEIWNEPDIDPDLDPARFLVNNPYGCWGDKNDPYFGGGYYGEMLKVVYPRIKQANPNAQVLMGGLLLDCAPAYYSPCTTSTFLEGILKRNGHNDGGNYFDGISFHGYDYAGVAAAEGVYSHPKWGSSWDSPGPVLINKTNFIKGVLQAHGVTGKFLMNTEVGVICSEQGCDGDFPNEARRRTKEYYVVQSYAAAIAQGLRANIWYTWKGWRGSGLVDESNNPYPAFTVYQYAGETLRNATLQTHIIQNNVYIYKFQRAGASSVWVLWSKNGSNNVVNLGAVPSSIYDAYGVQQTNTQNLTVGKKPLYVFGLP